MRVLSSVIGRCVVPLLLLSFATVAWSEDPLSAEARQLIRNSDQEVAAIHRTADEQVTARRKELIERLQKLQGADTKRGKLNEAAAIRNSIRQLQAELDSNAVDVKDDPGNLNEYWTTTGQTILFRVTGRTTGQIWGTDVYTDDSDLATAAVHAGVLRDGQEGVVKVTILPGQEDYSASERNGIASQSWEPWQVSFRVEAAPVPKKAEAKK